MANCSAARIAASPAPGHPNAPRLADAPRRADVRRGPDAPPAVEPRAPQQPTAPVRCGSVRVHLPFDHLGSRTVSVAYEAQGPSVAPAVGVSATVVLGGISAGRHLAPTAYDPARGWWPGVAGEGLALDPASRLLVGIDYLGGKTEDGLLRPVTTHDQARALAAVLDELGIRSASLVGASYGGMVALAFAELFPARVARLAILCAAHRTHPMATALRSIQRSAASLGVASGQPGQGLALARALAMTTYRSPQEFEQRFSSDPLTPGRPGNAPGRPGGALGRPGGAPGRPGRATVRFPVEEYLDARGADFARRFDVERFAALSESIDLHRTRPESLPPHTLLVSFDSDALVPPWLVEELATRSGRCPRHVTVTSLFGHDAFLKEAAEVTSLLKASLPRTPEVVR